MRDEAYPTTARQMRAARQMKIMIEGKEGRLDDLKQGDQVQASFKEQNGQNVATSSDVSESGPGNIGSYGGSQSVLSRGMGGQTK